MSHIKPTEGRIVLFCPTQEYIAQRGFQAVSHHEPMAAMIAYVHPSGLVNLSVTDHHGRQHGVQNVQLLQSADDAKFDSEGRLIKGYCTWMPYQKGQAAKTEALESKLAGHPAIGAALGERAGCGKCVGQCQGHATLAGEAPESLASPADSKHRFGLGGQIMASRLTPQDIEANIVSEYYFTAEDGVIGAAGVDRGGQGNGKAMAIIEHEPQKLSHLRQVTLCVLVLRNGTKIIGVNHDSIDPARHDPEYGRQDARANAVEQVWQLMGYELRTELSKRPDWRL